MKMIVTVFGLYELIIRGSGNSNYYQQFELTSTSKN